MKKLIIAALAASTAAVAYANAGPGDRDGRNNEFRSEIRALIDADGMKVEDLADLMKTRMTERFAALDADKNGSVTREEFLAASTEQAKTRFDEMNPDENGVVKKSGREGWGGHHRGGARGGQQSMTDEQRDERIAERFASLDTNSDGTLSRDEFKAGMQARGESGRDHGWRGGHGRQHAEMREEMRGMHREMRALMREGMTLASFQELTQKNAGARFDKLDAAGKGEVTLDEFTSKVDERAGKLFARMDRNDDGVVTKDDRSSGRGGPHRK